MSEFDQIKEIIGYILNLINRLSALQEVEEIIILLSKSQIGKSTLLNYLNIIIYGWVK